MQNTEIEALIKLIDDPDEGISSHVIKKLTELAVNHFEQIQEHYLRSDNELQHIRLKQVLDSAHLTNLKNEFEQWVKNGAGDLFEGFFLVAKYRYPDLDKQHILNHLDKIKLDIWLRLNHKYSELDNVKVINDVFYGKYRFKGDNENYYSPQNSYINKILENRTGNPISLSILYSILAQKLYLPILGVNLPKHFVLAYKDSTYLEHDERFNNLGHIPHNIPGDILFYINAYRDGTVFSKFNIDRFLEQSKINVDEHFYEPCPN
ncbi:MAG: transglutaminase family protein, partial [Bacteroidetes bacterium]|nr:transglutaminase family protein [Bacteroidota bacterium]